MLEAAFALVAEKGLEGLRTRDVAARAGVNISTLHYYFGTKEQLLAALIEHIEQKFGPGPHDDTVPGGETIYKHIASAWQTFQDNPALSQVLQEMSARAARDPDTHASFRTVFAGWNYGLAEGLRAEIEAGRLPGDIDPHVAAAIVTSFIMGAMIQLNVNAKAFDFLAVSRELERWAGATGSARHPARPRRR